MITVKGQMYLMQLFAASVTSWVSRELHHLKGKTRGRPDNLFTPVSVHHCVKQYGGSKVNSLQSQMEWSGQLHTLTELTLEKYLQCPGLFSYGGVSSLKVKNEFSVPLMKAAMVPLA
jgi:hypothetical protein